MKEQSQARIGTLTKGQRGRRSRGGAVTKREQPGKMDNAHNSDSDERSTTELPRQSEAAVVSSALAAVAAISE